MLSNHVGLRPRFIPLKGSSLRRLPKNITPLSVGFAVHKQSRRRAALTHGEIDFPVAIEVGSDHSALLTVNGDATFGSRHGGEVPRAIAAQQKAPTAVVTRGALRHFEGVLREKQIDRPVAVKIPLAQVKRRR